MSRVGFPAVVPARDAGTGLLTFALSAFVHDGLNLALGQAQRDRIDLRLFVQHGLSNDAMFPQRQPRGVFLIERGHSQILSLERIIDIQTTEISRVIFDLGGLAFEARSQREQIIGSCSGATRTRSRRDG